MFIEKFYFAILKIPVVDMFFRDVDFDCKKSSTFETNQLKESVRPSGQGSPLYYFVSSLWVVLANDFRIYIYHIRAADTKQCVPTICCFKHTLPIE